MRARDPTFVESLRTRVKRIRDQNIDMDARYRELLAIMTGQPSPAGTSDD